ncbi:MAG: toll/interleukin-1 receptor domain-containing protein [Acidobacteriota bacterium]|nr:toll/interleukin-1 receptor domain-containing protein [Acidobacteriota bacterium]
MSKGQNPAVDRQPALPSETSWTKPALADGAYDLFISYRSEKSGKHAVTLRDALYALDKRAGGDRPMRIFLDRISLKTGGLGPNIEQGLQSSRHLVVLLDETTIKSGWVEQEIQEWLTAGGTPERLHLVRTSPQLNLDWNEATGNFQTPEMLPPALSGLFRTQQKYVEFLVPPRRVNEVDLIGLYSSVMDADPESVGEDERRFLERQRSRNRKFISVLAGLLVVALVAGSIAVVNSIRADKAARQARADALAAESLLTIAVSPAHAIDLAVQAANLGAGSSVRAALLAVAAGTGELVRTFSLTEATDAVRLSGLSLSADDSTVTAWGPRADEESVQVATFSSSSGSVMQQFVIDRPSVHSLVEVPGVAFLGCAGDEALWIDWHSHDSRVLASDLMTCEAHSLMAGGVVQTTSVAWEEARMTSGTPRLIGVSATGVPIDLVGWLTSGWRADLMRPVMGFTSLTHIMTPTGVIDVPEDAQGQTLGRSDWTIATRTSDAKYHTLTVDGSDLLRLDIDVPPGAIDAAGWISSGQQHLAWITMSGEVGWTGGTSIQLSDVLPRHQTTTSASSTARPTLTPIANGEFVATFNGNIFTVSHRWYGSPRLEADLVGPYSGADPLITSCGPSVLINDDYYLAKSFRHGERSHRYQLVQGRAELRNCHAVEPGPPIRVNGETILESTSIDAQLSDLLNDGRLIFGHQDGTISLIKTQANRGLTPDREVLTPWRFTPQLEMMTAASGTAKLLSIDSRLRIEIDGQSREVEAAYKDKWLVPRPDGRGGLAELDSRKWLVDIDDGLQPLIDYCSNPRFHPGEGFATDLSAAQSPRPVGVVPDGPYYDCLTGEDTSFQGQILSYDIGPDLGHIIWRQNAELWVTTWRPGDNKPMTRQVTGDHSDSQVAAIDASGKRILVASTLVGAVAEYRLEGEEWNPGVRFAATVGVVSTVAFSPDGTLVMVMATDGRFDIFDAEIGRRLASQLEPLPLASDYRALTISEKDGYLLALVQDTAGGTLIEIPAEIEPLRDLLCSVHHAASCG